LHILLFICILKCTACLTLNEIFVALLKKQHFMRDGFVVTSPGRLLCSNIIHVKARNSLAGWSESIKKCLMETERLGLNSIAFPALGTGNDK
jgi:hypothetical protein